MKCEYCGYDGDGFEMKANSDFGVQTVRGFFIKMEKKITVKQISS